ITNIDNSVTNAMGNQTIAYKAGSTTKTVKLSEGFNFTNGTDTVASVGDNGEVSFDLNNTVKGQLASIADKLDRAALKTIESDDITVSNGGDLTAGKVKLTLKEARVKALAGTTNLETDYLKVDGSNIANNKATFGDAVGTTDLTKTTELAQIKAVKDVDDKVKTNTTAITNLNTDLTTQITNVGKTSKEEVEIVKNSGLTLDTTAATASKGAKYTLGLDADKIKEITGTTTLADDLAAKADRDAGNLGTTDVTKWKDKLDIAGVTRDTVADKLNASDITSVDKTVIIDTTGANGKGKVDLTVNLDGITLTKDNNGVISLADNGVTTNKIKDGNVTQAKLHTDVTNILNKVGTGAVETGNQNTVTGDVVKTYVDNSVGAVETKVTNLGDQITNVGKTSKEEVAVKPNSGLTLDTTAATTDKGAKYTLGLDVDKIKEITGTTDLATTYLKIDGSNIGDEAAKATLGSKVGKGEITGDTTQLVQEKAVKAYVDTAVDNIGKPKDGKDGYIGVDGKDGKNGVGIDGKDGITVKGKDGKDGVTIKGEDGANGTNGVIGLNGHDGIDGKDKKAVSADIKVVNGRPGVDGKDGDSLTRIIYEDEAGDTHTVATMDDGLVFKGDVGDKVTRKLNDTLNIKGGVTDENKLTNGNIGVVNDGTNGLAIKLAKELTALDSIVFGAAKGNDIVSISTEGVNAGGKRITNVGDATAETDAVNYKQLKAVETAVVNAGAGLKFTGNTADEVAVVAGGTLVVEGQKGTDPAKNLTKDSDFAADNLFVDTTDGKLEIKLAKQLQGVEGIGIAGKDGKDGVGIDGIDGISVKGDKGEVGINGNNGISIKGEDGSIGLSGKDGITVKGKDGANGTNGVIGLNGKDGDSLTRIIYEDEGGDTHTVATMDDGLAFQGDAGDKVTRKLNDTLNIKGGVTAANKLTDSNIGVVNDDANGLAIKLAKELTGISSIANTAGGGKLTLSDTENSVSVNGGRITHLGDATADTDAVNYKQLKALNSGKGIDVTKWQEAILPTINFFSGGTGTGANYAKGADAGEFDLSKLAFDFGDGLKVEKQQSKDGKQIAHITLDKDALKNDPNFK
ncbi:hypothetical protein QJU89_10275, partial [Pasteurella skyensis]|nr:hypothetical protein [Pasteurella skyensis]MDP8179991.1 hypothetical protein [Pasteurella skyensis]MDP8184081.1 hypothetical protein [Pasteurella skyensis]